METQSLKQVQSKSDSTDNSGKCIMISTSGGCCSTFLAQILSKIPNTRYVDRKKYDECFKNSLQQ